MSCNCGYPHPALCWPDIRLAVALSALADAEEALGMERCTCLDIDVPSNPCPGCFGKTAAERAMDVFEAARAPDRLQMAADYADRHGIIPAARKIARGEL